MRDLTRYRRTLIRERTREKQRVEKLLEDAQIKLSSVASDVFGVSGRQLLQAMIGGQRDPKVLAQLARASMRAKLRQLEEALTGHFDDHHAFLCRMMLERIDELTGRIEELTARIDEQVAPFAAQVAQLDAVTGIGPVCAQELIAELGADMAVFPTAGHLVAWAKFAPQANTSAGKAKTAATGKGNPWLAATLARDRRHGRAHQHLPRPTLPPHRQTPWQATRPGRGRQLGPDHHLAPAGRPRSPLLRPGPRLLPVPQRPAPPGTQPDPPAPTAHGQDGHPHPPTRHPGRIADPEPGYTPNRAPHRCDPAPPGAAACHPPFDFRVSRFG